MHDVGGQHRCRLVSTDKQYTGHHREGDLIFMKARFYDPLVGRFLQPDTIVPDPKNPQALNRYSYVVNNPLRYTDPNGRCGMSLDAPFLGNLLGICDMASTLLLMVKALPQGPYIPPGVTPDEYFCNVYNSCGWNPPGPDLAWHVGGEVASVLPFSGAFCAGQAAIHGTQCISQRPLGNAERGLEFAGILPLGKGGKWLNKLTPVLKFGDDAGQLTYGDKIMRQMGRRGWTEASIENTVRHPIAAVPTRDVRHLSDGTRLSSPATAYFNQDGSFVVVNDLTADVVQISDRYRYFEFRPGQ